MMTKALHSVAVKRGIPLAEAYAEIEDVDPCVHPDFDRETYGVTPARLIGYLDRGTGPDLNDFAFQILHAPRSISLWGRTPRMDVSRNALDDGDLLDTLYGSDTASLRCTLARLQGPGADVSYGGHSPSFGKAGMTERVAYRRGENTLGDVKGWYSDMRRKTPDIDIYADQDWGGLHLD